MQAQQGCSMYRDTRANVKAWVAPKWANRLQSLRESTFFASCTKPIQLSGRRFLANTVETNILSDLSPVRRVCWIKSMKVS